MGPGDSRPRSRGKSPNGRSSCSCRHDIGGDPCVLKHGPKSVGPLGKVIVPRGAGRKKLDKLSMGWEETSKAPGFNGKLLAMRSKIRRSKNWPGDLINSQVAFVWERDMVSDRWLPVDLSMVLVITPKFEQAVNVPLAVGRGSSSLISPPSVEVQPLTGGCVIVVEGSSGLEGEPGLIVTAMGGGVVQGSGLV